MAIIANGSEISAVYVNGQEIKNVYFNSNLVWTKSEPPSNVWNNAWSGLAYIIDPDWDQWVTGILDYTYTFNGISISDLNNKTIQLDAEMVEDLEYEVNTSDVLKAERDASKIVTNLPWICGAYYSDITLSALHQSGSNISITGSSYHVALSGTDAHYYFIVTGVWYFMKSN